MRYGFEQENYVTRDFPIFEAPFIPDGNETPKIVKWAQDAELDIICDVERQLIGRQAELFKALGHRIGFASFNIPEEAPDDLTGLLHNRYAAGRQAANILSTLIGHRRFGPDDSAGTYLVKASWCDGSTAPERTDSNVAEL